MYNFVHKPIGGTKRTAVGILQDNYPYEKKNINMWITFSKNITKTYEEKQKLQGITNAFLIGAEAEYEQKV